ncbi:hypothetical protein KGF56_000786 [Candida oxycetoniae]|uniref:Autophagy-related protein 25 n=1 Tax=Candida oxycetoniae TaxID=497107 RepID=A0AAI9SZY8_9ASCO|nr:uncharacterized protein KGF56_000786 [Candida oxycetoniae]KAI3406306.2 hypothetical protein KGF56_000786 [Candida oxycetoniae]
MSSMDLKKEIETFRAQSSWVDKSLRSRAYIDTKLLFTSINWQELISDQIQTNPQLKDLEITKTILRNDQSIISIIKELIASIDKYRNQQNLTSDILLSKNKKIQELNNKVKDLEKKLASAENKSRDKSIDQTTLTRDVIHLRKVNRIQTQNLYNLTNLSKDLKLKHRIDMKKKDLEISSLKNKLIERRSLSSTIEYGIPLTPSPAQQHNLEDSNQQDGIFHNESIIDVGTESNSQGQGPSLAHLKGVIDKENTRFVCNLTNIIESIATENYKLTRFIQYVKDYIIVVNSKLLHLKDTGADVEMPNPSDLIDLQNINKVEKSTMSHYYNEIESSETIERPVLNEIYKMYHNLGDIVELLNNPNFNRSSESTIKSLQNDLKTMETNWKDALKTSEIWKNLAKENQKEKR